MQKLLSDLQSSSVCSNVTMLCTTKGTSSDPIIFLFCYCLLFVALSWNGSHGCSQNKTLPSLFLSIWIYTCLDMCIIASSLFPTRVQDLDQFANDILDGGAELQSDHPGFNVICFPYLHYHNRVLVISFHQFGARNPDSHELIAWLVHMNELG